MLSYFSEELARNASRGVVNQISDVKLLQGDLSEAWREINDDYATVAMRYSLNDKIVDRATGRVVEEEPSEATEFWTFRRARERRLGALRDPADLIASIRRNANGRAKSPAILLWAEIEG